MDFIKRENNKSTVISTTGRDILDRSDTIEEISHSAIASFERTQRALLVHAVVFFIALFLPFVGASQAYLETFGQNRIQYRQFDWRFFCKLILKKVFMN